MIHDNHNIIPLIHPSAYHDTQIFQQEKSKILSSGWYFAGFMKDLQNPNDYITLNMGEKPVVIHNFNGSIKAFLNVCSHRFSQIQSGKGNRAFFCPYHGWAYNDKGVPVGIPKKPKFGRIDVETMQDLCLEEFQIGLCGTLVFIKKQSDNKISFEEFLGEEYYTTLKIMSEAFGDEIDCNEMIVNANWKILVENTLEAYHIGQIHPTTFNPIFGKQTFNNHKAPEHTSIEAELNIDFEKISSIYRNRPFKINGYFHIIVFPNVTIATSYGTSFSFQYFEPINSTQTKFTSYVFGTKLSESSSNKERAMINAMNQSIVEFNRTVFNEDKDICEKVQLGIVAANNRGLLSKDEQRVLSFHEAYNNLMN